MSLNACGASKSQKPSTKRQVLICVTVLRKMIANQRMKSHGSEHEFKFNLHGILITLSNVIEKNKKIIVMSRKRPQGDSQNCQSFGGAENRN
jgi:hypothetical protein